MHVSRRESLLVAISAPLLVWTSAAHALDREKDGWYRTGDGVRVKTVLFVKVRAYAISHYMKTLPATKSKAAVIALDTDKQFAFQMLRDVGADKIKGMFRDAFALNGYTDAAAIGAFVGAFTADLKEKQTTTILYDSAHQSTTVTAGGGGTATIRGLAFMQAAWSLWFGKSDQPELGDDLISRI